MNHRGKLLFLLLVIAQAGHSIEEYLTRLYEIFAPARFVSGLVSDNLATGFVIINGAIVVLGVLCYAGPVRSGGGSGLWLAWIWSVIELANGIGHIGMAVVAGGYFSGALTAIFLVLISSLLARNLQTGHTLPD